MFGINHSNQNSGYTQQRDPMTVETALRALTDKNAPICKKCRRMRLYQLANRAIKNTFPSPILTSANVQPSINTKSQKIGRRLLRMLRETDQRALARKLSPAICPNELQHKRATGLKQAIQFINTVQLESAMQQNTATFSNTAISNTAIPKNTSDAYEAYVLNSTNNYEISQGQIQQLEMDVSYSVAESRGFLLDSYTSNAIESSLWQALKESVSFRKAIIFGIQHNKETLGNIRYENRYEVNDHSIPEDFSLLDPEQVISPRAENCPIVNFAEASEGQREGKLHPIINIGAAPNTQSSAYPQWQLSLMHEIMHHLTGSGDPGTNPIAVAGTSTMEPDWSTRLGPTENLARQVAKELGWPIPSVSGYRSLDRDIQLAERDHEGLKDLMSRHPSMERPLMQRMASISSGSSVETNFTDIEPSTPLDDLYKEVFDQFNTQDFL